MTAVQAIRSLLEVDGQLDNFTLPDGVAGHGPTEDALRWVARIYVVAYAVGWEPGSRSPSPSRFPMRQRRTGSAGSPSWAAGLD